MSIKREQITECRGLRAEYPAPLPAVDKANTQACSSQGPPVAGAFVLGPSVLAFGQ